MSRSRKHPVGPSPRTGTLRRGARHNDRTGLPARIEDEYGWDPRHAAHERLWLGGNDPARDDDGEPTRAVRSFALLDDEDES